MIACSLLVRSPPAAAASARALRRTLVPASAGNEARERHHPSQAIMRPAPAVNVRYVLCMQFNIILFYREGSQGRGLPGNDDEGGWFDEGGSFVLR